MTKKASKTKKLSKTARKGWLEDVKRDISNNIYPHLLDEGLRITVTIFGGKKTIMVDYQADE